ncbi:MAG: MFS transporter [Dehalococcoidia bacterium]
MADTEPAAESPRPRLTSRLPSPRWLLLLLGAGVFFGTLDQTVVVTVLPDVIKDIHLPINTKFGEAAWIVNGYLLGYTVAMPVMGRLADVLGRVRIFLVCLGIFMAGSVLVAISPNLPLLVAARAFQAIGGGGLLPVALAIAADTAPAGKRTLVLGSLAAANNGSTFLGPVWGAAVAGLWSWRAIFWLNVPLVIPIALGMPLLVRERRRGSRFAMDWPGAALLVVGLTAITFALTDDGANPRPLVLSLTIGLVGGVALALFARVEWRASMPMVDLRVLRLRRVAASMLIYFLIGGALITALVVVPLMSDVLYGSSTRQGGLNLMRLLLLLPAGGIVGGWLAMRAGNRYTVLLGLACACGGFVWMRFFPFKPGATFAAAPSTLHLWGALGMIGFGLGLCDGPIVATVVDAVAEAQRATASALLLVVWTTGMIVGLALLATQGLGAFTSSIGGVALDDPNYAVRFQGVLHRTFDGTFVAAAAALIAAMALCWYLHSARAKELIISPYEGLGE